MCLANGSDKLRMIHLINFLACFAELHIFISSYGNVGLCKYLYFLPLSDNEK